MDSFNAIKKSLEYIDAHLDENINYELLARRSHFSAFYFHRLFGLIVGKTITNYIRDRRLLHGCMQLVTTNLPVIAISLNCGYNSPQAFTRAFRNCYKLSPSEYRNNGIPPEIITVDEMIMKFTNRIKGGVYLNPKIFKEKKLLIACVSGDGNDTGGVWGALETLSKEVPLKNKLSENGYEIRVFKNNICTVYVGYAVSDENIPPQYTLFKLPSSKYASFDVYVQNGYGSENNAMNEWLETNPEGYKERLFDNAHYCVEYYDERFNGEEAGSIVEIWIPIE